MIRSYIEFTESAVMNTAEMKLVASALSASASRLTGSIRRSRTLFFLPLILFAAEGASAQDGRQRPATLELRWVLAAPQFVGSGIDLDIGLTDHLAVVASAQHWKSDTSCLSQPGPCGFDGLSFGGGVRYSITRGGGGTPFVQAEGGVHNYSTNDQGSPVFGALRTGMAWNLGPRGVLEAGAKYQFVKGYVTINRLVGIPTPADVPAKHLFALQFAIGLRLLPSG